MDTPEQSNGTPTSETSGPRRAQVERVGALVEARAAAQAAAPPAVDLEPEWETRRAEFAAASRSQQWRNAIPSRFQWASVDHFADASHPQFFMPDVAGDLAAWASPDVAASLLILGPVGTAKTYAAIAAARIKFDQGFDVTFLPVVELLHALRPGGPEGLLDDLSWVDVLVLDDLGTEKSTEWTAEQLYAIVNRRWMEALPTIVTSNVPGPELRKSAGARVFSRLIGDGAKVLHMSGDDRRLPPKG